jgi:arachidonate 15-lipoxygenase
MQPNLPQNDSAAEQRKAQLERNRALYEFDPDSAIPNLKPIPAIASVPGLPRVPPPEALSSRYSAERTRNYSASLDPFDELQDYEDFLPTLGKPEVIETYQTDSSFAEQRLSGVNPMVLRRITEMSPKFPLTLKTLQTACEPSLNLEKKLKDGHLYVADYTGVSFVQGGTYLTVKKYLPKPLAFFCWQKNSYGNRGELIPVAIQIDPKPNSPIFTPRDKPMDWFVAKICVQIADANHHEMSSHLCRTHFVMAPFAIVTARQLAQNHPLGLLLRPHFQFMLAINDQGRQLLINPYQDGKPGGHVDRLLAGTLEESLKIFGNAYAEWSLDQFALPTELKNRGVDDVECLPHYPYRDDAMLLWQAIHKFVSNFVGYYYKTPEDLKRDYELQNWAAELNSRKVKGVPVRIETVEQLIEIITTIIFTCGPQHSAVNFPQYDYIGYVPNMPFAAYRPIPGKGEIPDEKKLMEFLPPQGQADRQVKVISYLSVYQYDKLGYYDDQFNDAFRNTPVKLLIQQFQQDLTYVEHKIEANNRTRYIPYNYLRPSLVPNSIST